MRRSGGSGGRRYSLYHLLSRQPKSIRKDPYYPIMINHFKSSARLQSLRIGRRCYTLLHEARISPEHLGNFYRTYRLPRDPFFPLFFSIKRSYLRERLRKKEERRAYIAEKMRSLPGPTLSFITYLARVERTRYNRAGRCPVWDEHLFPSTKKRVHEYERYDRSRWLRFFRGYMAKLEARYRSHGPAESDRLLAYFTLQYHPQEGSGEAPDPRLIRRNYRRLSKLYHPDAGGDPEHFVELKRAFDSLLTRGEQEQK